MRSVDAVVIGGGCVGTSVLHHLALQGCTDTLLLEAGALGGGSTSKAAGGIRMQHDDELNTRLALRSLDEFTRFEELTGTPIDFHQVGYLFLLDNDRDLQSFRRAADVQRALGVPTEELGVDAVRGLVPGVHTDDLLGATYCALEGYAAPEAVVQGYAAAARRLGARLETGTPVLEILVDGAGVSGVRTADGTIATRRVVIAAGVGSREVAATVGFDLPVHAEPRTIFYSGDSGG
ncbi:MAG: FAD-binding oxidoreductase, partial [Nocardioides sp.]